MAVIIVGGGIAGLWLLEQLRLQGQTAYCIEADAVGNGQTRYSQGMIHGGQRYTLRGAFTDTAHSVANGARVWLTALNGGDDKTPNLCKVPLLAEHQYLFATSRLRGRMVTFMASKAMRGRVTCIDEKAYAPILLQRFIDNGLYRLDEPVVDPEGLLTVLQQRNKDAIFRGRVVDFVRDSNERVIGVVVDDGEYQVVPATVICCCAGAGNEALLALVDSASLMQRRPLRQLLVDNAPTPLYGHCIDGDPRPRLTVTAHPNGNGRYWWYLGGRIASDTLDMTESEAIAYGRKVMQAIWPQIVWRELLWSVVDVERAEPKRHGPFMPDSYALHRYDNVLIGWPVKMTLAPLLANAMVDAALPMLVDAKAALPPKLGAAVVAPPIWEQHRCLKQKEK